MHENQKGPLVLPQNSNQMQNGQKDSPDMMDIYRIVKDLGLLEVENREQLANERDGWR